MQNFRDNIDDSNNPRHTRKTQNGRFMQKGNEIVDLPEQQLIIRNGFSQKRI